MEEEVSVYGSKSTMTRPLKSYARVPADLVGSEQRMEILRKAMKLVAWPLWYCQLTGLL